LTQRGESERARGLGKGRVKRRQQKKKIRESKTGNGSAVKEKKGLSLGDIPEDAVLYRRDATRRSTPHLTPTLLYLCIK
jgi:hypothetical protein